jgi:hypothetical protein
MASTILTSPIVSEIILPFVLIFVVIFAILQKTKVLGDGKRQIDSLVALVIALITVSFTYPTGIITKLMPFLAVFVVVLLMFMIIMGFSSHTGEGAYSLPGGLKITVAVIGGIALIIAVLWSAGVWGDVWDYIFNKAGNNNVLSNVILIIVIGGVIAVALTSGKGSAKP